ncbi:MAG: polysaccharide deacetylase family protein [Thermoleophilia bacterium]|nr:polysaccharide deacetylase family protein [Thermoleophilia bacterium]
MRREAMRARTLRILMYHAIGEPGEPAARFVVPLPEFERQIAWLARGGFAVVALESALHAFRAGAAPPRNAVAITFDDGTRDLSTVARPVLERYGAPATAFVVTRAMGSSVGWTDQPGLAGRSVLDWREALALEPLVALAPHTCTHPSLPTLDDDTLAAELRGSREELEQRTGRPAELFAYPYGRYDARVVAAVAEAGFTAACSVRRGPNDSSTAAFELRRYEVRGDASFAQFVSYLRPKRLRPLARNVRRRGSALVRRHRSGRPH